ncbi:biliverdin-producing heme oxygenase [Desulfosoma sp.]
MEWIERLRTQTRDLHKTAHALPFFEALWKRTLPLESFVGQLRCLAVVHGALEKFLASHATDEPFRGLLAGHCPKLPLLLQDLELFRHKGVQDILPAVDKALDIADRILVLSKENRTALVGYFYTLEGSTLGGRVMAPKIRDNFPLPEKRGTSFFTCYGDQVQTKWNGFLETLGRSIEHDEAAETVISAAGELFRSLIGVYEALYPFEADQLGRHVVSLNPEAGRHPMPADEAELQAALQAAERCWDAFPYFALRYGERGRRFAASDAAFLTTLCDVDMRAMVDQVYWLADVLAARGIPTWLTETQLRFLHEELVNTRPEKQALYDRVLLAADALRTRRHAAASRESIEALAHELHTRYAVADEPHWASMCLVLAAAAADEASGIGGGLEAVLSWLRNYRSDLASTADALKTFLKEWSRGAS